MCWISNILERKTTKKSTKLKTEAQYNECMSQQPPVLQNLKWNEWIIVGSVIIPIQSHTLNSAVSWLDRITFPQMFFVRRSTDSIIVQYNVLLIRVHSKGKHHKCWDSTKISFATQLLVQHLDPLMRLSLNVLTPSSHSIWQQAECHHT